MNDQLAINLTSYSFLGVATLNAIAAIKQPTQNTLSILILLIAYFHYNSFTKTNVEILRHSDWILTCPLLVYEIAFLIGLQPFHGDSERVAMAAVASVAMVGTGYYARKTNSLVLWSIGSIFLAAIFYLLLSKKTEQDDDKRSSSKKSIGIFFLSLWVFYGIVFWAPSHYRQIAYTLLDFLTKSVFGFIIAYQSFYA